MVEIDHKIVITAVIALMIIEITLILANHDTEALHYAIVGIIGLMAGVVLPTPKIDNKQGVLKW